MNLPELSHDEFGALRDSIQQDGVQYPVLLDRHGDLIDGFHRRKVCAELGIDCPSRTLDVDDVTAGRLRVSLNVARRHLSTLDRMEMIAWLAEQYAPEAAAAALERMAQGGKGGLEEGTLAASVPSSREATEDIAERIRADAAKAGQQVNISRATVARARKAAKLSAEKKGKVRAGEMSLTEAIGESTKGKPKKDRPVPTRMVPSRRRDLNELDQAARIRAIDAERQYQSMLNAPSAKLNLPLLRRAEKIMEMLTELIAVDPAKAASQLPVERCRDFTLAHAEWWQRFAEACDERRRQETPDLAPRPFRPTHAVLNSVVIGTKAIPMEERGLAPGERAVLEWIRAQPEPVTAAQICIGIRNRSKATVQLRLRTLRVSNLIEEAGRVGREVAYRAVGTVDI
jgi:hypothetical protein